MDPSPQARATQLRVIVALADTGSAITPVTVTSDDYHIVMKRVGVAELKARLSEHLRYVRRGRPLLVLDRDRAVARLLPVEGEDELEIREPAPGAPRPADIPLPPPLGLAVDPEAWLLEDRRRR
jgi:antitoxin (DNA-binding transcriptional repressor) of toxin-antitoxin stability system